MTTWFTSDTHFGHTNIIKYCDRPFTSVEEMDESMISYWNRNISPDDLVYHLGDFTLGGPDSAANYFTQLNGQISVCPGGHDSRWFQKNEYHSKSGKPVKILQPLETIKISEANIEHPQIIVLCHYAMRVWDRSHYGTWHLHGHSHCKLSALSNSLDVGVDCWGYRPISFGEIRKAIHNQNVE